MVHLALQSQTALLKRRRSGFSQQGTEEEEVFSENLKLKQKEKASNRENLPLKEMELALCVNTNTLVSLDAQKASSSRRACMLSGCGNGDVSLYYSKGFHHKSQSTMAGEQTKKATKGFQT